MNIFQPTGNSNRKLLARRAVVIGAQAVFCHALFWQPFVMFWTSNTAIGRLNDGYPIAATVFGTLVLTCIVLLYIDFLACVSDLRKNTNWTTVPFVKWIGNRRAWMFYICSMWSLLLMTTVNVEHDTRAVIAYALFFIVMSAVGLFLSLRDGCIFNRLQQGREFYE